MIKLKFLLAAMVAFTFYSCDESEVGDLASIENVKSQPCKPGVNGPCPQDGDNGGPGFDIPTYDDGYEDGYAEGESLAKIKDVLTYDQLWKSYNSYPHNFPEETQNFPYFNGKYIGIVDGWMDTFDPSPCTTIDCLFPVAELSDKYKGVNWEKALKGWAH